MNDKPDPIRPMKLNAMIEGLLPYLMKKEYEDEENVRLLQGPNIKQQ